MLTLINDYHYSLHHSAVISFQCKFLCVYVTLKCKLAVIKSQNQPQTLHSCHNKNGISNNKMEINQQKIFNMSLQTHIYSIRIFCQCPLEIAMLTHIPQKT